MVVVEDGEVESGAASGLYCLMSLVSLPRARVRLFGGLA